ncbi:unnamed protein product [Ceratitis capitata]|uniref:(Mediterranean fruit fly) hypothetical protein n=1 Tax=Ceratitis capitata TaxID=7213 RepID=A0A811UNF4_CERCA|nr:unnamed protein product [Ceratitis capitata]
MEGNQVKGATHIYHDMFYTSWETDEPAQPLTPHSLCAGNQALYVLSLPLPFGIACLLKAKTKRMAPFHNDKDLLVVENTPTNNPTTQHPNKLAAILGFAISITLCRYRLIESSFD